MRQNDLSHYGAESVYPLGLESTLVGVRQSVRFIKTLFKLLFLAAIILRLSQSSNAKDWRGLIPLHSTRDDVTRLLGPSPDANNIRARYSLERRRIYRVFERRIIPKM